MEVDDGEIERIKQRKIVELMRKGLAEGKETESNRFTQPTESVELNNSTFFDAVKRSLAYSDVRYGLLVA